MIKSESPSPTATVPPDQGSSDLPFLEGAPYADLEQLVTENDSPVGNLFSAKQQRLLSQSTLRVYQLGERGYRRICQPWFAELELGLQLWPGTYEDMEIIWLRWCDAQGVLILTGAERAQVAATQAAVERQRAESAAAQAEAAAVQAESAAAQAEAERQRADTEYQRAERLAARLRELGIEEDL